MTSSTSIFRHSSPPPYAARLEAVTKVYGEGDTALRVLDNVTVDIHGGEFTAIMGASGAGKSTLMQIMAGLDTATAGRVWIGDTDISQLADRELTLLRRRRIGFIFQAFNLVPTLNVRDNILLPIALDGRRPSTLQRSRLKGLAERLGIERRLLHRPHELSGGQQQRVAIARALISEPEIVFADELTGSLDSRTSGEVLQILRESSRMRGQAIVMVTHDPFAAAFTDHVLFLGDGSILADRRGASAAELSATLVHLEQALSSRKASTGSGTAR